MPTHMPLYLRFTLAVSLVALCLGAVLGWVPAADAAPKWVRIGLPEANADSSMRVAWSDDTAGTPTEVQYGKSGGPLSGLAKGTSFKGKGGIGTIHEALLTQLLPNTQYDYRVGGGGTWSTTYKFRTAPKAGCSDFAFIAGGDHRSDDSAGPNPKWASIIAEMKGHLPRFVLESGDLVRDGADEKQWVAHMKMAELLTPWVPMMPCLGNHDTDKTEGNGAYYNQLFPVPTNDVSKTRDYYAFAYGNMVVVALSTATFEDGGFAAQAKWLDQVLTAHKDKAWKVLFYHHPSYTSYVDLKLADLNHPPDEKKQNQQLLPVIDKHGVDLVFAGHNHFYERFAPKKGGKTVGAGQGTVFVTSGGAGAFTYDEIDIGILKIEPMKIICGKGVFGVGGGQAEGSLMCSGKHHYVLLEVKGDTLSAKVLASAAQNFGTSDKNKGVIDTFTLTKTGASALCQDVGPGVDAGGSSTDAGGTDAGVGPQTDAGGSPDQDAGQTQVDAGQPQVDAGQPQVDAGTAKVDAGQPQVDAGQPQVDAGQPQVDAGQPQVDAGPAKIDGGDEQQDAAGAKSDTGAPRQVAADGTTSGPAADAIGGGSGGQQPGSATAKNDGNADSGCSSSGRSTGSIPWVLCAALALVALRRRASAQA